MRLGRLWLAAPLAVSIGIGVAARSEMTTDDLVVHEWGTFLATSGSDGAALDGMYHEEHALPAFVHARGRDQLRLPSAHLKGETPVIYFYTARPQSVRVTARFPRGVWTQWYPQAELVGPQLSAAPLPSAVRDGHITWSAEIIPDDGRAPAPAPAPPAAAKDALWNFAREVDAAFVRTTDRARKPTAVESERFLFYRGLGRASLPLRVAAEDSRSLSLACDDPHGVRHVFVIRVAGGRGAFACLPDVGPGARTTTPVPSLEGALPLEAFGERIGHELVERLVASGLYRKEARAMVNTWRSSYFETEGVRVLFVLPRPTTDALIPLHVAPEPKELVRVMVGRVEVLTPEREQAAELAVRALASPDGAARDRAYAFLRDQGRYVEPILRRVLQTTTEASVRTQCQRLLLTDFVTELRAAVHAPANGARVTDDPVHVRAQLASLLREIGQPQEARQEGAKVEAALRARPAPPIESPEARTYLRAAARAADAMGDDREAAARYARFVRFGSQVAGNRQCVGCHQAEGPREMSWYRDWWAGRKYAQAVTRAGLLDESVARQERALAANPGDVAARMMLAYLREAKGEGAKARSLWTVLCDSGQGEAPAE
jgi:hypothetical protein